MPDCDEGDGEAAAEEKDEEGGQAVTVVDSERQVLKNQKQQIKMTQRLPNMTYWDIILRYINLNGVSKTKMKCDVIFWKEDACKRRHGR